MQDGGALLREHDTCIGEQLVRFLEREAQVGRPDLGQLAREAQAVQPELWIPARRQNDPKQTRTPGQ